MSDILKRWLEDDVGLAVDSFEKASRRHAKYNRCSGSGTQLLLWLGAWRCILYLLMHLWRWRVH